MLAGSGCAFAVGMPSALLNCQLAGCALHMPWLNGPPTPGAHMPMAACSNAVTDAADAQGAQARLRSKQLLLDVLCERIRQVRCPSVMPPASKGALLAACCDLGKGSQALLAPTKGGGPGALTKCRDQSSYTRVAVLQTWEYLAQNRAIPLGHWQVVTNIATGAPACNACQKHWCCRFVGCPWLPGDGSVGTCVPSASRAEVPACICPVNRPSSVLPVCLPWLFVPHLLLLPV